MKFITSAFVAGALLIPGQANAQNQNISYSDSVKCSALHAYLAGVAGLYVDELPAAAAAVEQNTSISELWMVLAILRDENDGDTAIEDLPVVIEALGAKLAEFGEDENAASEFLSEAADHCLGLQQANGEDFAEAAEMLAE